MGDYLMAAKPVYHFQLTPLVVTLARKLMTSADDEGE